MQAITDQRATIDALDAQLVQLIQQRLDVARAIQADRLAAGGPRIVHSREAEVVARWREELGAPGSRIALALLELSRGPALTQRVGLVTSVSPPPSRVRRQGGHR